MNKWIMQENNTKSENQIKLLKTWIKVLNKEQQYLKRKPTIFDGKFSSFFNSFDRNLYNSTFRFLKKIQFSSYNQVCFREK